MPKYQVTLGNGHTYEIESDRELSDQEAQQHAEQAAGGGEQPGFFSSLWDTVNPMNLVRGAAAMIPGTDANKTAVEGMAHENPFMAAVRSAFPLTGGAGARAGARVASGDVRGGAGELVGDMLNTAAPEIGARIPGGISAVGRGVEKVGAVTKKPLGMGALVEAAAGHPAAAVATYGAPYAVEAAGKGMQRVGSALEGIVGRKGGVDVDRYLPSQSSAPVQEYTPSYPSYERPPMDVPASAPRVAGKAPTLNSALEDALQGILADDSPVTASSGKLPDTPSARFNDVLGPEGPKAAFEWPEVGEKFAPDASGSHVAAARENIDLGSSFGNGHILPEGLPTELRDAAVEGLYTEPDAIYSIENGVSAKIPRDLSFEAGNPDVPGVTIGSSKLDQATAGLPESWKQFAEPTSPSSDGMPVQYTDWAKEIDDIINSASADELARNPNWRSRPTKAETAAMRKKQQANPDWPYRDSTGTPIR